MYESMKKAGYLNDMNVDVVVKHEGQVTLPTFSELHRNPARYISERAGLRKAQVRFIRCVMVSDEESSVGKGAVSARGIMSRHFTMYKER